MAIIPIGGGFSPNASTDTVRAAMQTQMNAMPWDKSGPMDSLANTTDYFIKTYGSNTGVSAEEIAAKIRDAYAYNQIDAGGYQPASQTETTPASTSGGTPPPTDPTAQQIADAKEAQQLAGEQALYDQQISNLDRLLGTVGSERTRGLTNLNSQKDTIMTGYAGQKDTNAQNKRRGLESVDRYAQNTNSNLQRLLQGANAGNSSMAQTVIPYTLSKSAGQRRQGVFDTAGENERNIDQAMNETTKEFGDEKTGKKGDFLAGLLQKQQTLDSEKALLQTQKMAATGAGYNATAAAAATTRANMTTRDDAIKALLGNFAPVTKAPELSTYQVDPGKLKVNQGLPQEAGYYLSQLLAKRKQEQV